MEQNNRILFINPIKIRPVVGPIAFDYLGHVLKLNGYIIDFIDNSFSTDIKNSLKNYLNQYKPLAIGITVRNTDDCYFQSQSSFIDEIKEMATLIKSIQSAPIILGGVGFSLAPEAIMNHCGVDFGVQGDGEEALLLFLKELQKNQNYSKIPNLIHRKNGKLIRNPSKFVDLNLLGSPTRKIINNLNYFKEGGQGNIETKRGCDRKCIYCADPVSKGRVIRFKDPQLVCDEFRALIEQKVTCFHLCDSEFNNSIKHTEGVCKAIIEEGLNEKMTWYAYCIPKPFSDELGQLMKDAGCVGIDFGVDSGDNNILKTLKRDFTVRDIIKTAEVCKSLNIIFMYDLLIGGPGETNNSIKNTIELMKKISPNRVGLSIGIRIYPGTEFAKLVIEQGPLQQNPNIFGVKENNSEFLKPIFYLSSEMGGKSCFSYISKLVGKDSLFFFADPEEQDQNYNYNENLLLVNAIKNGYRGAYWDILRRLA
ncbi:MAG: radical SAM protein, partial [Candidatus Helarchaeota archaeon]|nr:radical SAM protein [Candidatus Helarchaeota archaeon]